MILKAFDVQTKVESIGPDGSKPPDGRHHRPYQVQLHDLSINGDSMFQVYYTGDRNGNNHTSLYCNSFRAVAEQVYDGAVRLTKVVGVIKA